MSSFRRTSRKLRRNSQAAYQRTRKAFFESLERREMLTAYPVANNDPIYNTPLNTQLTTSTAVLANDVEEDSHSLTAAVVDNPSHGTLTSFNTSTGQFVYTPTTGYEGLDSFTYEVDNGTYTSNVATVTIAVGGVFGPRTNLDDQPLDSPMYTGANTVTQDLSLGEQLIYRSDTVSLKPVIAVETSLKSTASVPNSISAVLTFDGVGQGTVSYTNSGLAAGDTLRFALQADATSLATGMYDWSMAVTADYGGGNTKTTTFTGSQAVVNRTGSEYGKGWWLDGLDQLVVSGSGALLVRGNGDTLWFKDNGSGYDLAAGDTDFSTLVENGGGDFTLTDKHGMVENFDSTGLLTSRVDPNSNTTAYAYTDGDSDSVSDELYTITDPYSRVTETLAYSSSHVSTFTDMASHVTTLAYTSGKLTSVTLTDPDGGGALAAPVWDYAYNGTTGLLETQTDPNSEGTGFVYDSTSLRLSRINYPTGTEHTLLTPVQTYGLKTGSSNALVKTVNPQGVFTDENGNEFKFKMDRFGNVIQFGHDFSGGSSNDVTDTSRDPNGLPYKILQPAIDSVRYQTLLGYDSVGDVLKIINPDNTTQTFTYDSTFHNVLTATDEMARVTTYTYNAYGNVLTQEDNAGNTWTTDYTGRSDGLPTSITSPDPDGAGGLSAYVTQFDYDSYGQLETTTYPDSSTQVLAYNTAGLVTSVTDELSHVTAYAYDALNRLTSITGADPDGGGGLASPVTSFTYDGANNLLTQTDALGNTTTMTFDERNRMLTKTLPDPDGVGGNAAPEFTYDYDGVGNEVGHDDPNLNVSVTNSYDAYGRMTDSAWGTLGGGQKDDSWTYDVLGRMTSHTNSIRTPYVETDTYAYDSRGRMVTHTGHDRDGTGMTYTGASEYYTYNAAGQPATHTDFLGNVTSYDYTTAGWLNSITLPDPDGSGPLYSPVYTFGYDALGNETGITDPNNNMSSKTYDNRGRLASETGADPDGAGGLSAPTTSYGYDDHGNLTSVTSPLSAVTSYGYDNLNRQISMTLADPDGAGALAAPVYAYGYNAVGSMTTQTDPLGNVTTTALDNLQRVTSVTDPDPDAGGGLAAPVTTYAYGSNTLLETMTDPMGHNTDYGYDDYGRQTTVTNNDGYVTTTAYNLLDQVTSVTTPDPDGVGGVAASVTTNSYDYLDRLSNTSNPLSGNTAYTYDLDNNLINLRDPDNNDTAWAFDGDGRVTMETNELNKTRSFYHDAAGNLTRKEDRDNRVTQYTFDDLDRMTSELWIASGDPVPTLSVSTSTQGGPSSEVQRVGYNISGGLLMGGSFTLSFGGNTTSSINYDGSAATVQSALEGLASIGSGNVVVTKSTNTSTHKEWTITFQGSLAGANQAQITVNNGSISFFGGTKTDVQATDTQGGSGSNNEVQVITLAHATDGTFRLAFGGQTTAPIAYNASASTVQTALTALTSVGSGNVSVSGSSGGPWTATFQSGLANTNVQQIQGDAASAQSGSVSRTISYTYDTASQLTAASDPDSSYAYTYDAIGRELTVDNNGTSGVPRVILTSVYDAASNRTKLSASEGGTADFENDYTFDNMNRMTRVEQVGQGGGNTVAKKAADFNYNALSQFTSVVRQVKPSSTWNEAATTAFTYDTLNRIDTIAHKQSGSNLFTPYSYTYDHMDRITGITSQDGTVAYSYDKTSQLTGADYDYQTDETFAWDANGNPSGGSNTVGTNNRLTSDGTYNYTYDDEGNLTRRTKISDSSYTDYTWDYRNRLTNVTNKTSGGTSTMSADYTYDVYDRRIKKVVDADGAGAAASTTARYVYFDNSLDLQFDGSNNLTHRYLNIAAVDQILSDEDSTNAILWPLDDHSGTVRDLSNSSGSIQNHIKYDSFGNVTSESAPAVDFLAGFGSMLRDEETGSTYAWHRFQWNGRWLSEDPIEFQAGDSNIRRYATNNAVSLVDRDGLEGETFSFGDGMRPKFGPAEDVPPTESDVPAGFPRLAPPGYQNPPSPVAPNPLVNLGPLAGFSQMTIGQAPSSQGGGLTFGGQLNGTFGATNVAANSHLLQVQHIGDYLDVDFVQSLASLSGSVLANSPDMQLYIAWQNGHITKAQYLMALTQLQMKSWVAYQPGSLSTGVMGPNYQFAYQHTPQGSQAQFNLKRYLNTLGPMSYTQVGGIYGNGPQGQTIGGSAGIYNIPGPGPFNGGIYSGSGGATTHAGSGTTIHGSIIYSW